MDNLEQEVEKVEKFGILTTLYSRNWFLMVRECTEAQARFAVEDAWGIAPKGASIKLVKIIEERVKE